MKYDQLYDCTGYLEIIQRFVGHCFYQFVQRFITRYVDSLANYSTQLFRMRKADICMSENSDSSETANYGTEKQSQHSNQSQIAVKSENVISTNLYQTQKIPKCLKSSQNIRQESYSSIKETNIKKQSNKISKIVDLVDDKIKKIKKMASCQICQKKFRIKKNQLPLSQCVHQDNICQSCIHHYVIYKVKRFEIVLCPHENCDKPMALNGGLFKQLPISIQKRYKKIHRFYETVNNPSLRICPQQDCQGFLNIAFDKSVICGSCLCEMCSNCLLDPHEGECQKYEIQFLKKNLKYRQCQTCKFVIQKDQGCSRMTCRCGYMFCYVCGAKWTNQHFVDHDEDGNLVSQNIEQNPSGENNRRLGSGFLERLCGATISSIFKSLFRMLLMFFFIICMAIRLFFYQVIMVITLLLISLLAGIFAISFEIMFSCDTFWCLLGAIFFPACMIIGIQEGILRIFIPNLKDRFDSYWSLLRDGITDINNL